MNAHAKTALPAPHNIEAEQMLLGSILTNNNSWIPIADFLKPEHFYEPVHQQICSVCADMIGAGRKASPISIKPYLDEEQKIGSITLKDYLFSLCAEVVNLSPLDQAKSIYESYLRRQAIVIADELIAASVNFEPTDKISELASLGIAQLSQLDAKSRYADGDNTYQKTLVRAVDSLKTTTGDDDRRIPWFLPEIQACAGHARPGNLIGVMSDSGGGKTSFSLQQCRYAAEQGFKSAFFSIEITNEEAALQAACQKLQIPMETMDDLKLSEEQETELRSEMGAELPFRIIEFGSCTTDDIAGKAASLKRQHGLDLLIIDHAKLVGLPGRQSDLFAERVNQLYRTLKAIAKDLQIAIVILIQRNDAWKKRSGPRPMEGDAYGGGGVKQNLDVWFSIYRPDVFEAYFQERIQEAHTNEQKAALEGKMLAGQGKAWIINHKRRRGAPELSRAIRFKAQTVTFKSIDDDEPIFADMF